MKLNENFIKHSMDDTMLMVPLDGAGFSGIVRGNRTVGVILEYLERDISEEELIRLMCERFDGDPASIRADVADVIGRLREIGAIDE